MLEIIVTDEFRELYLKLPAQIRKKAEKQEIIFRQNPFHPSLHIEKLEPKGKQLWSIRVDRAYRIIFRFLDNKKVLFLVVGHYHWIYRKM